ncbi:SAM-dependent methyltransferase [Nocardia sp. NPDC003963]
MTRSEPALVTGVRDPVGVDTSWASIARVYDYSLGGKDNYEVDRTVFEQVRRIAPRLSDVSRMNRRWLHRVVRYLVGQVGIDQFLDVGAGLPTALNTHEVAQLENRTARVVYIDNDPLCAAHGRVMLAQNTFTHFVCGDLLENRSSIGRTTAAPRTAHNTTSYGVYKRCRNPKR